MLARPRDSSLARRLVAPVVGLVLVAVLANTGFAAYLTVRRSLRAAGRTQAQVAEALAASRVTLSPQVLEALHALTGSHFLVWNPVARAVGVSTLPPELAVDPSALAGDDGGIAVAGGRRWRIGLARSGGVRPETVIMLTPVPGLVAAAGEAAGPILAVGAATLLVLVPLGLWTTRGLAGRIAAVERQVARIAAGEFGHTLPDRAAGSAGADEIGRLVAGVNHMSTTLASLRSTLVAGERQRLLGQLAAGFAHELRNAITGARLAIDLHRRRCHPEGPAAAPADDSLAVATRQLDVVAEEVRGLLALGRPPETAAAAFPVGELLAEVRDLTGPRCDHAGVALACEPADVGAIVGRRDALRAALVNLALNAIDAAGRDGAVRLSAHGRAGWVELVVEDDGAGPPEAIRDALTEPFVTGRPEGIGLGLAVARAVAESHGGRLAWDRHDGWTRFALALPTPGGTAS